MHSLFLSFGLQASLAVQSSPQLSLSVNMPYCVQSLCCDAPILLLVMAIFTWFLMRAGRLVGRRTLDSDSSKEGLLAVRWASTAAKRVPVPSARKQNKFRNSKWVSQLVSPGRSQPFGICGHGH